MKKTLTYAAPIYKSGLNIGAKDIETVKPKHFRLVNESIGGDAPKDILELYEFIKGKRNNWDKYISKIGHKWYPNESITEQFMTEVGKAFGINIADSRLLIIEGCLRFNSKHFHTNREILSHGANIISKFLRHLPDASWMDELDKLNKLKENINIDQVIEAIKINFCDHHVDILNGFFDMILYDAYTGNNDRHYYNWGVIESVNVAVTPYFSPIYDSARALYWNLSDEKVISLYKALIEGSTSRIDKYIENSVPKISLPQNPKCNHYELIKYLVDKDLINREILEKWKDIGNHNRVLGILTNDFNNLYTAERIEIIKYILNKRFKLLNDII